MTTDTAELTCTQDGCPFPDEQQCLEGFDDFVGCPFTKKAALDVGPNGETFDPTGDADVDDDVDDVDDDEYASIPGSPSANLLELGGGLAFSMEDVTEFLEREAGTIVLIAGPVGSGKTTLVVELYARFLYGPFAGATFSGSETLRALDSRHFPALEKSGGVSPTTTRTSDEDLRLLHLRLNAGGSDHNLLFSDVRGEFFENVIDGESVQREIPLVRRVDRCLIVVDGERAANPRQRDAVFTEARQLAGGLRSALSAGTPVAVLCTKWDLVESKRQESVRFEAERIASFAAGDSHEPIVLTLSVRPGPPASDITGLVEVLDWLRASSGAEQDNLGLTYTPPSTGRHFLKEPGSA
ncbi:TRAFAC clade GTPase domain-containing protein [Nocardioides litoris]|uniref:TRAFAC clade GTPase domain-containing protein n=1 Tax=Nocardioides litoris TaxID=1926648 RepID=UPI00111E084D|nr:hypothetical protein [Nocardioides litoris]